MSKDETNGQVSPVFPVVSFTAKKAWGKARSEIFNVSVDPRQGNQIYTVINALDSALVRGSVSQLEALQKPLNPLRVSVGFKDSTSQFQFFHLIHRTLKSNGQIHIQTQDGDTGDYLYIQDGRQTGKSYQQLATQAATYIEQLISNNTTDTINTQTPQNPGQSFLGSSHTRNASFEARVVDKGITLPSVQVQYRWEGFNISEKNMVNLVSKLSNQYGFKLYDDGFLNDTKDVKMYALDLDVNLYQAALDSILTMSETNWKALESKYKSAHHCDVLLAKLQKLALQGGDTCAEIDSFGESLKKFQKGGFKNAAEQGKEALETVSNLERFVTFHDLVQIVGGTSNIYVNATLNGYRDGAEENSSTLNSNDFGTPDAVFGTQYPGGIVDEVAQKENLQSGEFDVQWMRDIL